MLLRITLILLAMALSPRSVAADDCIQIAGQRIFTSDTGFYGLRLSMNRGTFFNLDSGKERVSWQAPLLAIPSRALVSPDGQAVVTLDVQCRRGFEHSLVIYGSKGRVLADYRLEELLTAEEIKQHVRHSVSSRWWTRGAMFTFESWAEAENRPVPIRLRIRLAWGKEILVDLGSGSVLEGRR